MLSGRARVVLAAAAAAVLLGVGAAMALLPWEIQLTVLILVLTAVAAIWLIPAAVTKEPTVTAGLLAFALAAKVVGAMARYGVLQVVYGGSGDAVGYHSAGTQYAPMVRALDFSFVDLSTLGTPIVGYFTGLLYAVITPSMPAAFLVFSMLSFIGVWCFYRAHRISFPDGNHRLYFLLLFFLPTMVYWPSSLGKDALVILGLGVATLGLARIYQRPTAGAFTQLLLGLGVVLLVREAVALMLLFGATAGLLIRPGPVRSPLTRPMAVVLLVPVLAVGLVFAFQVTAQQLNLEQNLESVFQKYETTQENLQKGGSSFDQPDITSPASALVAAGGVLFRPFPWELGSGLGAITGLEGMVLFALFTTRLPAAVRAMKLWRGGMVVTALTMSILLIATLSAFTNFGLLARQRSQAFPFVLIVFTAVAGKRRIRQRADQEAAASTTEERTSRTASATAAG